MTQGSDPGACSGASGALGAQRVELGAEGADLRLKRLDLNDDARGVVTDVLLRERPPDPLDRCWKRFGLVDRGDPEVVHPVGGLVRCL